MTTSEDVMENSEFRELLNKDPIDAFLELQIDYNSNDNRHTNNLCLIIHRAAQIYAKLNEDDDLAKRFFFLEYWLDRKYRMNPKYLLYFCMLFLVGKRRNATASDYSSVVLFLLDQGVTYEKMEDNLLKGGGPYAIKAKYNLKTSRDQAPAIEDTPESAGGRDSKAHESDLTASKQDNDDDLSPHEPSTRRSMTRPEQNELQARQNPTPRLFDKKRDIAVAGGERLKDFFDMHEHEQRWVLIERGQNEGKIARYKVIDMRP